MVWSLLNSTPPRLLKFRLPALTETEVSFPQFANTSDPTAVVAAGIATLVRLLQKKNALFPMLITPDGMAMLASEPQY